MYFPYKQRAAYSIFKLMLYDKMDEDDDDDSKQMVCLAMARMGNKDTACVVV